MKLFSIMWSSYLPLLREAAAAGGVFHLSAWSSRQLNLEPELLEKVRREMRESDLILLYQTGDAFWGEIEEEVRSLGGRVPVVAVGPDPSCRRHSTVSPEVTAAVYRYILFNGRENFEEMLKFLHSALFSGGTPFQPPREVAWEGVFDSRSGEPLQSVQEFLAGYPFKDRPRVGVLFSRSNWATGNLAVERSLIAALEDRGLGVVPVFYYSLKDGNIGNLGGEDVVRKFFVDGGGNALVKAIVKLSVFFLGQKRGDSTQSQADSGAALLRSLNVPLINPVISYYKSAEQWLAEPQGLGQQTAWSIALPEFEGVIEPMIVGASGGGGDPEADACQPLPDRIGRLAARVARWVALSMKPNSEKRVAFILHNNPCASVEATVGGGAHLDTLESVARILARMRREGYSVDPPANGKELIEEILARKAISEFRWTTVQEIEAKGGTLSKIEPERYLPWFEELPAATRERMIEAWGKPPGEEKDGIPAAMVLDGKILVTGVRHGNAVICVQPKRGCAGARCDGQVCKILHDPAVPPPHQYVATYKWLSRDFRADAVIHVGTHGNLEFLPGKSTGLSSGCFPDIGIDEMPHLYIYNADNPPEGTIAKRRSYATLVDHMQTVMVRGGLYGDLDEIERLLFEYEKVKETEPGKAHALRHMIEAKLRAGNLEGSLGVPPHAPFDEVVKAAHEALSLLKNSYIPRGMHTFGSIPQGEALSEFVYAIVRYENGPDSLRGAVGALLEKTPGFAPLDEGTRGERVDEEARSACGRFLEQGIPLAESLTAVSPEAAAHGELLREVERRIEEVKERVLLSDEVGALLNGFNGGYIPPGPSGIITRGRPDILPTGRNFYSLDPRKIPSDAAWIIGRKLASKTIDRYLEEEGRYPENIAFYWQCTDIMWSDGEGMAQMMALIGVKPKWDSNGRVNSFEIIPSEELGRPRIDLTIRVSGITRDNFPSCIDVMDEAVQAVARLDEPPETNFVRKHLLEFSKEAAVEPSHPDLFRRATYRIFAAMPGVYQAGTQLAVYASAWKDENDLSDVFLSWNGYAYGRGVFGEPAHDSLAKSLKTVELTFNKTVTDEYDLLGCCAYFGTHGGLVNAARVVSGKQVKTYYGDTREQGEVQVRDLAGEIRRVVRSKLLNPRWIEGMKDHGYKGAGEISKRVGRVYGWEATTREVDDWIFDDITRTFLMDEENRKFFEENNPYALEETARRLMEAAERGLWNPSPDTREALGEIYIEIEGWIEERLGEVEGDFQGGAVNIVTSREVEGWRRRLEETLGRKE
ncbi:MAG: cobaltochelatase subunit CobN [Syntrophobacteraceae bacterium]